jgi:Tfp pilus assembly protein PilF
VEAAQKAIALDPYNSEYRHTLAQIYESAQSVSLAVTTYEDILKWDPQDERALSALAVLKPNKGSFLKRLFGGR